MRAHSVGHTIVRNQPVSVAINEQQRTLLLRSVTPLNDRHLIRKASATASLFSLLPASPRAVHFAFRSARNAKGGTRLASMDSHVGYRV